MRILITGSTGFIGRSLKQFLEKKGISIVSYDIEDNPPNSILDLSNLKSKVADVDGVVHLAAMTRPKLAFENPRDCVNINIAGTANVLEAIRQVPGKRPWLIFISSREVFGEPETLPITEQTLRHPQNLYGMTKFVGEELCRIFSESYGLKIRILRFTSVYGGADDLGRVVPKFIVQALKNEPLTILGNGEEFFDFTHVNDITQGIWQCIQEIMCPSEPCDDFILSYGQPVSLKELTEIIIEETKSKSSVVFREARQFSTVKSYANPEKARKVLGFDPKIDIKEGTKLVIRELKL